MEEVFSVPSVPGLYNEDQLQLRVILETAVRRAGGWYEMAASLQGHEPGSKGTPTVESVARGEKSVAEAGDSSGTQRKGSARR
jgi:hypothetical protein